MTLEKAIELNISTERSLRDHKFIDHADAVKIGNEALIRVTYQRKDHLSRYSELLPGETET